MTNDIEKYIDKAVSFLYEHQLPNGEFCCYIAPDEAMQIGCEPDSAVFPASLIAYPLLFVKDSPKTGQILDEITRFLQFQMIKGGVWKYYTPWNKYFNVAPPDTDDTVCASDILRRRQIGHWDPTLLLLLNRNSKGLFYTWHTLRLRKTGYRTYWRLALQRLLAPPVKKLLFWLLNECAQNDIDAVVNANTLFYFGLNNNTRPIIPYLIQIIADKKEHDCDKWYRNPFTVYYFFSRCYAHGIKELAPIVSPITERILNASAESGMLGTSIMDTALGCCTLMNVGYYGRELQKGIDYIIHAQQDNGSWARWAFYYSGPKKKAAWGSEELTTGFCIEALARYQTVHSTKTADG